MQSMAALKYSSSSSATSATSAAAAISLPPPCPRSPPKYPDMSGKHRELVKVQKLEREIGFLEEELKSFESLQPASRSCKEVDDYVGANPDPLIPINQKIHRSCRFWRWLCGNSCLNLSWICCFHGCSSSSKTSNNCDICSSKSTSCSYKNCCGSNPCCRRPQCCCQCGCGCSCNCFGKKAGCKQCCCKIPAPSCPDCSCSKCFGSSSCFRCPKSCLCFNCKNLCCCNPCSLFY